MTVELEDYELDELAEMCELKAESLQAEDPENSDEHIVDFIQLANKLRWHLAKGTGKRHLEEPEI